MKHKNQVLGAIGAGFSFFVLGTVVGYPTKSLPLLTNPDSDIYLTEQQGSWFVAISFFIGMLVTTPGGILSSKYGRRLILIGAMPFVILGWLLIALARDIVMLFAGRLIVCSFTFLYATSSGVYVSETVHPNIRGKLVIVSPCLLACGYLTDWTLGYFLTWRTVAYASILPCVITMLILGYCPETPYWLIENDQYDKAQESLKFFRGSKVNVIPELNEIRNKHLSKEQDINCSAKVKLFFSKSFLKPFSCVGIISMLWPLTGFDIITMYMVSILEESGSSIDPGLCVIFAGIVRLISSTVSAFIYKHIRPKLLYVSAQFTAAVCMALIGLFAYLKDSYDLNGFAWIPLVAILLTLISRGIGTLPVIFTLINEIFPTEIRTQSYGITQTISLLVTSVTLVLYPTLKNTFGFHGLCIFYSAIGILSSIWGAVTIPDNRGKSLVKVEESYEKK